MKRLIFLLVILFLAVSFTHDTEKINGINFVAPSKPIQKEGISSVTRVNADWIALIPYSFMSKAKPELRFDTQWQWWGERTTGIEKCIDHARASGLKIMIKPHIWVKEEGWAGDFEMKTEADWKRWEADFETYILTYARLAAKHEVELLCIGTEIRKSVQKRTAFWKQLITKIRAVYFGKLTYAANWDNFHNIKFWDQLDYIGIDAYFPLVHVDNPSLNALTNSWKKYQYELAEFSERYKKPIIFTEYGYRSINKCAGKHWEIPDNGRSYSGNANLEAQSNAYLALYKTFWNEPWFKGGFLWKWYDYDNRAGGGNNTDFTPQNKPVEKVIKEFYSKP